MSQEERTEVRLARAVAAAAAAWLRDPQDVGVYARLVQGTRHWNAFTRPMLEGTHDLGPLRHPTASADRAQDATPLPEPSQVRPVGALLAGDPHQVLARLTGRSDPDAATGQ